MKKNKSSSGDGHPYLKGWRFWNNNQFWHTSAFTHKARLYFNESLNNMQNNSRALSRIDETIL